MMTDLHDSDDGATRYELFDVPCRDLLLTFPNRRTLQYPLVPVTIEERIILPIRPVPHLHSRIWIHRHHQRNRRREP